jgi:YihY family inner membrane protein
MEAGRQTGTVRRSWLGRVWRIVCITFRKYFETDGEQRAASFAYYAFFALFPLILLFVTVGSMFINQAHVSSAVIEFVGNYIPMGDDSENAVIKTINGVVQSWKPAGVIAIVAVIWSALGLFHALVRGINRAWGTLEYPWWKMPIKNLYMTGIVGSALLIGVVAPAIVSAVEAFTWRQKIPFGVEMLVLVFSLTRILLPTVVLFYGFAMFYKFAPRRRTTFREIWLAALLVSLLLQMLQYLFVLYVKKFPTFNAVYGAFGGVVALLMWIYLSGSIIILGGCLSAAQSEEEREGKG